MEIVDGLYQLKTPMPIPALPYIMPYAFTGGDGVSLLDGGYGTPNAIEALTAQLKTLGYEPKDIRRQFITHAHPDHYGMTSWIKEQSPDCEVIMLEREWQWVVDRWQDNDAWTKLSDRWLVTHGLPQDEIDEAHRQGALGPGAPAQAEDGEEATEPTPEQRRAAEAMRRQLSNNVEPDVKLQDGEIYEFDGWRLQAVWTPGHTPGHLCMYEPDRKLMFTGDHVLPHISPNVSLHADQEGSSPLSDFRDSLQKVAAFDTTLGLRAHEFTMADLRGRCELLLHHHDERLGEVRDAIGSNGATGRDVSRRVRWNTGPFDDFNLFMKRSALGETLSHLQLLLDEERVKRQDDGERVIWTQA